MEYETPQLYTHGTIQSLTWGNPHGGPPGQGQGDPGGNDPCTNRPGQGGFKQTGLSDGIQHAPNSPLASCSP